MPKLMIYVVDLLDNFNHTVMTFVGGIVKSCHRHEESRFVANHYFGINVILLKDMSDQTQKRKYLLFKKDSNDDAVKPCAFFASPAGCRNGNACAFSHGSVNNNSNVARSTDFKVEGTLPKKVKTESIALEARERAQSGNVIDI